MAEPKPNNNNGMLILTRRLQEVIKIGDNVSLHILMIDKNKIKIGIEAPKHISIIRDELLTEIEREHLRSKLSRRNAITK